MNIHNLFLHNRKIILQKFRIIEILDPITVIRKKVNGLK